MISLNDLVNRFGGDSVLAIRNSDGVTASLVKYTQEDQGLYNPDEDVIDLLSQSSIHDLQQLHQTDELDFFSVLVVDV